MKYSEWMHHHYPALQESYDRGDIALIKTARAACQQRLLLTRVLAFCVFLVLLCLFSLSRAIPFADTPAFLLGMVAFILADILAGRLEPVFVKRKVLELTRGHKLH